MPNAGARRYTIREEAGYRLSLKHLRVTYERMDQAMEGLTFILARSPEIFPEISGLRRARIDPYPGVPECNVWFRVEGDTVCLLLVEPLDPENTAAGGPD